MSRSSYQFHVGVLISKTTTVKLTQRQKKNILATVSAPRDCADNPAGEL